MALLFKNLGFMLYIITYCLTKGYCQDLLELTCFASTDCKQFEQPRSGYNVSCSDGRCVCMNSTGEQTACKPNNQKISNIIGGPCPCALSNADCNKTDDVCYCAKGFISSLDRRRCIKESVLLEETCEDDSQCTSTDKYSECNLTLKQCRCITGFLHEQNGVCTSVIDLPNMQCIDDAVCQKYDPNATCIEKDQKCACPVDYFFSNEDQTKCITFMNLSKTCNESIQCKRILGVGSECYKEMCACDSEHYKANLNGSVTCKRRIQLAQYCHDDIDCHDIHLSDAEQSMKCVLGECNCKIGFQYEKNKCINNGKISAKLNTFYTILIFSCFVGYSLNFFRNTLYL